MNLVLETEKIVSIMCLLTVIADGAIIVQKDVDGSDRYDLNSVEVDVKPRIKHNKRNKRHSPLNESQLCKAFGCKNGECVQSEMRNFRIVCSCYTGYEGKLCDRLVCPYDCGNHGTCVKDEEMLYCKCDAGYSGVYCNSSVPLDRQSLADNIHSQKSHTEMKLNLNEKLLSFESVKATPKFVHPQAKRYRNQKRQGWLRHKSRPNMKDFHSHADIDKSVRPEICAPGFKCYHGRCDRNAISYGIFRCMCQERFSGLFCEKRCTLNCFNGGFCTVLVDGHQYCVCPLDFTGHYCEKPYQTEKKS